MRNLWVYKLAGFAALGLGIAGIFLPLLPTTPFALVAAYFFSKSSPKWHSFLINHKIFGPLILDWQKYGRISIRAKVLSVSMIILFISYPIFFLSFHWGLKLTAILSVIGVITFILSRPHNYPVTAHAEDLS